MSKSIPIKSVFFNGSFTFEQIVNLAQIADKNYETHTQGTTLVLDMGSERYVFERVGMDQKLHSTLYSLYSWVE